MTARRSARDPPDWLADGDRVAATVLGTYHMAQPGNDVVNVDVDDVLAPARQAELRELVDRLADWNPDRVALELPADWQSAVEDCYDSYRFGEREFDRHEPFPEPFPEDFARNEAVQVGFRVADRLDHDRPLAVDHDYRLPDDVDADAFDEAMTAAPDPADAPYPLPDPEAMEARANEGLATQSVLEYHRTINAERALRENHALMYAGAFAVDDADVGVGMLAAWYERNLRTLRTLWERLAADDERVLVLFGAGHARVLRHGLDEAPMFEPVDPLEVLGCD